MKAAWNRTTDTNYYDQHPHYDQYYIDDEGNDDVVVVPPHILYGAYGGVVG